MPKETIFTSLLSYILGHKYYANIINTQGMNKIEISSFIFSSQEDADKHKAQLKNNRSFMYVETISFRSFKNYKCHNN